MLHIIQNDPQVPPGNIAEYLDSRGVIHLVHHPYLGDSLPDLRDVSALIVLGGAMGANDDARHPFLYDLKLYIRKVVQSGVPYLGICLGGQLLAAACGGAVISNRWEELGSQEVELVQDGLNDRLFKGIASHFLSFQWHHDSFDIPAGAALLASSPACPHQAFRLGESAWGTQFHPEVTEQIIRDWCAWDHATEKCSGELARVFKTHEQTYCQVSQQLLENFLAVASEKYGVCGTLL